MFGADPDSVAGMAKAYMKFRKPGQQHEMDASREVAALFLAVQSQVGAQRTIPSRRSPPPIPLFLFGNTEGGPR